ncbi:MAG TPA: TetR/AcrR family transcriptional regulator [Solirubrobacterales bacterium]|jgi:AcrR family transcriptional regulator|nr:TetR/AcrR family transcriptional regulator [Solirubrobacterales bacterium]
MASRTPTRTLSTAEERRETVIAAAIPIFAARGYDAGSTMEIAKAAGISQAYVFRLFPTKAELFAAVVGAASDRMQDAIREAGARARGEGHSRLESMGTVLDELTERDRDVLLIQLHSQVAAGHEPLIRDAARRCFRDLYELVERESGASEEELRSWFAIGMLNNVMAAIDADQVDEPWANTLTSLTGSAEDS